MKQITEEDYLQFAEWISINSYWRYKSKFKMWEYCHLKKTTVELFEYYLDEKNKDE